MSNNTDLQDLTASRITVLVPIGTSIKDAEKFALSYKGKVVICKAKEVEEAPIEEIIKSQRGWFSWMNPWNWFQKKEETDQEGEEQQPPLPPPEESEEESKEEAEEEESEEEEPKLITPQQLWIHTWVKKFGATVEEATNEWELLEDNEAKFFVNLAENRNRATINTFIAKYPKLNWTKEYLSKN